VKKSSDYYNDIADNYRQISEQRKSYLDAIDEHIIDYSKNKLNDINYLDIGAGDGFRSLKIAKGIKAKKTVLLDNSDQILAKIESKDHVELVTNSILEFESPIKFNLITCLWNVLGHVGDFQDRKNVFVKVETLLSEQGVFIFDVNNRYNIAHYGNKNVMRNLTLDHQKSERAGWFTLNENGALTDVYVHSPFDLESYLKDLNLEVAKVEYIDYSSGEKKATFFEGQLLYYITKKQG
jgi:SAM-dependent methyltransferase